MCHAETLAGFTATAMSSDGRIHRRCVSIDGRFIDGRVTVAAISIDGKVHRRCICSDGRAHHRCDNSDDRAHHRCGRQRRLAKRKSVCLSCGWQGETERGQDAVWRLIPFLSFSTQRNSSSSRFLKSTVT